MRNYKKLARAALHTSERKVQNNNKARASNKEGTQVRPKALIAEGEAQSNVGGSIPGRKKARL